MSSPVLTRQVEAHRRAARQGIARTAEELNHVFGPRVTAAIAGVRDAKAVGRWIRGADVPRQQAAVNLENAYQVVQVLLADEDEDTVRAWFRGMNPDLGDRPPALVIREAPERVMEAARAFVAG